VNHDGRRRATKVLGLSKDRNADLLDSCILCAFVKVQIIGARETLYADQQGRQIDLVVNPRVEPPYGFRFPFALEKRPPCAGCKGGVRERRTVVNGEIVSSRDSCPDCYGTGRQLRGDEFAPLCESCAQFVMAWLEVRGRLHVERHMTAGGKLMVATPAMLARMLAGGAQQDKAPGLARIGLPGIQR